MQHTEPKDVNEETVSEVKEEESDEYTQEFYDGKPFTYRHVRRWTRRLKIPLLHHHLIMCPINFGNTHWGLHGLRNTFLPRKTIHQGGYFDSLGSDGANVMKTMQRYYEVEYKDKDYLYESRSTITRDFVDEDMEDVPIQKNHFDCGVWLCINAFCMVHFISPQSFEGSNKKQQEKRTKWFRKHMFSSITQGRVGDIISYPALKADSS